MQTTLSLPDVVTLLRSALASADPNRSIGVLADMLERTEARDWFTRFGSPTGRLVATAFVYDAVGNHSLVAILTQSANDLAGIAYDTSAPPFFQAIPVAPGEVAATAFGSATRRCIWRLVREDGRWVWRCI